MGRSLKYMFVTRTLTGGGAERFITTFTNYLAERGERVYLVNWEKKTSDYILSKGVKELNLPKRPKSLIRKIERIKDMSVLIKEVDPDIVIPFLDTVMFCTLLAMLGKRGKMVYTVRVSPWHRGGNRYTNFLEDSVARFSDAIMIQTKDQAPFFRNYSNKIYVVPNPVNERFFEIKKEHYAERIQKIIMVGRLEKQKNYDLAVKCFAKLKKKYPDLELKIYGEGTESKRIDQLITELGLTDTCQLMGKRDDIESVLVNGDLFVMSSDYEGLPNALMEAMAVGLPCVSSDCKTGPRDLIDDNENGLLFKTGSVAKLYKAMEDMIKNPKMAAGMGKKARLKMQRQFTLERSYQCFIRMCRSII